MDDDPAALLMAMRRVLAGVTRVTSSPAMRVAIGGVLIAASLFDLMDTRDRADARRRDRPVAGGLADAYKDGRHVRLVSRRGVDHTKRSDLGVQAVRRVD
jgi:hypothetical protein